MTTLHDLAAAIRLILGVGLAAGSIVTLVMSLRAIRRASAKRDEIFGDPLE